MAVVPGLIVLLAIVGLTNANSQQLTAQVSSVAPGSAAKIIQTLIHQAEQHQSGAGIAAIAGFVIAVWAASGYVGAFMRAANRVYDIGEGRPMWKTAPLRLAVTLFAVAMLVVMAALVVVTGSVARSVGNAIGVGDTVVTVWDIAKWPVLALLTSLLLAVLFWAAPNVKQGGIKWIRPGGAIATILWLVLSALFSLYVAEFSSYNKTYGFTRRRGRLPCLAVAHQRLVAARTRGQCRARARAGDSARIAAGGGTVRRAPRHEQDER